MTENTDNKKSTPLNREGLTLVLLRNAFYRDNYYRATLALTIVFFINVLLSVTIIYRYLNPPEPVYFATNSQYQLIKYHPLSDPMVSNNYVLQWVSKAVRDAFSLDFIHWRSQLQNASNNFTTSGWHWFTQALGTSNDLKTLVTLKMVSDATVTGAPVMQYQGVLEGRYLWKIEMPILISYTNLNKTIPVPLKVTLIVVRVPVQDNPNGIEINQFLPVVQAE